MVDVDDSSLLVDSQSKLVDLFWGSTAAGALLHSSNELGELLQ